MFLWRGARDLWEPLETDGTFQIRRYYNQAVDIATKWDKLQPLRPSQITDGTNTTRREQKGELTTGEEQRPWYDNR